MKFAVPSLFVVASLALAGYFLYVTTSRNFTQMENVFFQVLILLLGLGGTLWIGRILPVHRTHARSAFRRLTSLYSGLGRAAAIIDESRESDSVENYRLAFARLEELIRSQLIAADDALEDWRDIVPKDVGVLQSELPRPNREQE